MSGVEGIAERLLRRDKAILIAAIVILSGLAGLYTLFGVGMNMTAIEMTAGGSMASMSAGSMPGGSMTMGWTIGYAVLVFLMWWVMMMAMMLPSVAPTVLLYAVLLRRGTGADRVPLIAMTFLAGYLLIWGLFSLVAATMQWVLETNGYLSAMTLTGTLPGALVLIAAGVFQFTPLKEACLRQCRSPAEFITRRRRPGAVGALVMGLDHGLYCLGCCWFLMALLFVGGIMNLYWIVGLAAFVAIEKLTPWGPASARIGGAIIALWGLYILVGLVLPGSG